MKQSRGFKEKEQALTLTLEQYSQIIDQDDQFGEKADMLPFIFLMVVGIFFVTCVVFKCELLSLIL